MYVFTQKYYVLKYDNLSINPKSTNLMSLISNGGGDA